MSFVFFPSLVHLPSSSPVYLFLFWIPWVPSGHCSSPLPHFFGWSSIECLLAVGSYCFDFRVIRECLAGIPPLYHLFDLLCTCPIMHTSYGPNRSFGPRIRGSFAEEPDLGQTSEGSSRPAIVVNRVPLARLPSPFGKGRSKVSEIRYPSGSDYLRVVVQNAEAVGPSRIKPSFGKTFAARYRPPFGVHVWCPDFLTSYIVQVPKMVCFSEAAFENDLCFPLHPFIKSVLQYFNVCPSQLSSNFWGVLVGLLVVFRDKGLRVPSIALLLDFFSVKETVEGFLYISKRTNAKLIIKNLPSSHKHWKERHFFISGHNWEYNPADREDTLGIPTVWTAPENLREFLFALIGFSLRKS